MSDYVIAKGMQFWGTHGYYPEENIYGAKFIVDVVAEVGVTFLEATKTNS